LLERPSAGPDAQAAVLVCLDFGDVSHADAVEEFVPPLLYSIAARAPQDFYDVTVGGNAIFGGSCCPARPGYDLASGLGSPFANGIAAEVG